MATSRTSRLGKYTSRATARRMLLHSTTTEISTNTKSALRICANRSKTPDSQLENTIAEVDPRNGYLHRPAKCSLRNMKLPGTGPSPHQSISKAAVDPKREGSNRRKESRELMTSIKIALVSLSLQSTKIQILAAAIPIKVANPQQLERKIQKNHSLAAATPLCLKVSLEVKPPPQVPQFRLRLGFTTRSSPLIVAKFKITNGWIAIMKL
jgi:hypothetical protein